MSARRLRAGEWLAGAGAVALLGLLFANWFDAAGAAGRSDPTVTGLASLGALLVAWLVLTALLALWLVVATAAGAPVGRLMVAAVLTVVVATVALAAAFVRVTIAQPGLGAGLADSEVSVAVAGYLGLAAVAAVLGGAWRAMADERTDAPESAYTPPPPRPAPPAET